VVRRSPPGTKTGVLVTTSFRLPFDALFCGIFGAQPRIKIAVSSATGRARPSTLVWKRGQAMVSGFTAK
jgi:hypothetical protein